MGKVLLIGRHRDANDYVGARTKYLFKTLTQNGIDTLIWDWKVKSREVTVDVNTLVWLPWIAELNCGWLRLLNCFHGKRYLWTEQFNWSEQCRSLIAGTGDCEFTIGNTFNRVCYSSMEDIELWGVQAGQAYWPPLVHEDVVPSNVSVGDSILIDSYWPYKWSDGEFNARDAIDDALARKPTCIEDLRLLTQPDPVGAYPVWTSEQVPANLQGTKFLEVIARSCVFVTTHHELLGLQQFEALACGVPVVVAREHAPMELSKDIHGVFLWSNSNEYGAKLDPVDAGVNFLEALEKAIEMGRNQKQRNIIRESAITHWGSTSWWSKCSSYFEESTKETIKSEESIKINKAFDAI